MLLDLQEVGAIVARMASTGRPSRLKRCFRPGCIREGEMFSNLPGGGYVTPNGNVVLPGGGTGVVTPNGNVVMLTKPLANPLAQGGNSTSAQQSK
jgi:hypothetical protein